MIGLVGADGLLSRVKDAPQLQAVLSLKRIASMAAIDQR